MRVRRAAAFGRDLAAQFEFLIEREDPESIARLEEDLTELEDLVGTFPDAGREVATTTSATLRKLKLRRTPFVAWYRRDTDQVTLVRLFHARQARPIPRL